VEIQAIPNNKVSGLHSKVVMEITKARESILGYLWRRKKICSNIQ